jgi:signal transduction histidine kinase
MADGWLRTPRRLRFAFGAVMVSAAVLLVWLASQTLHLDRQERDQRRKERLNAAADVAVATLDRRLAAMEAILDRAVAGVSPSADDVRHPGMVIVRIAPAGVAAWPKDRLLYGPAAGPQSPMSTPLFEEADRLEFMLGDYPGAIVALAPASVSHDPALRAAALARIARNQARAHRYTDAMRSWQTLAGLGSTPVDGTGLPAALAGRLGLLRVAQAVGDRARIEEAAGVLDAEILSGRWLVSEVEFSNLARELDLVLPNRTRPDDRRQALARAVAALVADHQTSAAPNGRLVADAGSTPVLLCWRRVDTTLAVLAALPEFVSEAWLRTLDAAVALADSSNRTFAEDRSGTGLSVTKSPGATGLPWKTTVFLSPSADEPGSTTAIFILTGLSTLMFVVLAGTWFVGRAATREIEAARLQSEFVSAVSHEFRTPLTTLCQLSELLVGGRVATDGDRAEYFALIHRESHRLRRLVEGVLDFSRTHDASTSPRRELVDAAGVVERCVARFVEAGLAESRRLDLDLPSPAMVLADPDGLDCVVWNLVENAVKYSPGTTEVHIRVSTYRAEVEIAVRDLGLGIPAAERSAVFGRFVRGKEALARRIQGTGLGLATADAIVRSHGGRIRLTSEPGQGSTFTVRLPAALPATTTAASSAGIAVVQR